jgi:hypothetical protein
MANAFYPSYKQQLGEEKHNMTADDIRAILVDAADYTYSSAHDFLDDVAAGGRVAVSGALASPSFTAGVFDSADFSWTAVTGDQSENIILYNHDGNGAAADAARQLIIFYDTGMTGMPVTPNGGNINVTVNASGWFAL